MITINELCDEICDRAVALATRHMQVPPELRRVATHPETFQRFVDDLRAKVGIHPATGDAFVALHTAAGAWLLTPDPTVTVLDHLRFAEELK